MDANTLLQLQDPPEVEMRQSVLPSPDELRAWQRENVLLLERLTGALETLAGSKSRGSQGADLIITNWAAEADMIRRVAPSATVLDLGGLWWAPDKDWFLGSMQEKGAWLRPERMPLSEKAYETGRQVLMAAKAGQRVLVWPGLLAGSLLFWLTLQGVSLDALRRQIAMAPREMTFNRSHLKLWFDFGFPGTTPDIEALLQTGRMAWAEALYEEGFSSFLGFRLLREKLRGFIPPPRAVMNLLQWLSIPGDLTLGAIVPVAGQESARVGVVQCPDSGGQILLGTQWSVKSVAALPILPSAQWMHFMFAGFHEYELRLSDCGWHPALDRIQSSETTTYDGNRWAAVQLAKEADTMLCASGVLRALPDGQLALGYGNYLHHGFMMHGNTLKTLADVVNLIGEDLAVVKSGSAAARLAYHINRMGQRAAGPLRRFRLTLERMAGPGPFPNQVVDLQVRPDCHISDWMSKKLSFVRARPNERTRRDIAAGLTVFEEAFIIQDEFRIGNLALSDDRLVETDGYTMAFSAAGQRLGEVFGTRFGQLFVPTYSKWVRSRLTGAGNLEEIQKALAEVLGDAANAMQ